ncbi:MAG: N-acetylmuramoyl-L-alanine amidase family protein [Blautia sp.]
MKQKTGKRFLLCAVMLLAVMLLAVMLLAVPTQAAARYKKQWKKQNQNIYYYNEKGKKLTGFSKIGKKTFYFDQKGAQHVGWQKIGNDYYYFNIARGSNGSMVKSAKVNGITIDRTGKAKKDSASLRRLRILLVANQTVERITKPLMPKKEKLKICFEYAKKNFGYFSWRGFSPRNGWEMDFAEDMFLEEKATAFLMELPLHLWQVL